MGCKRITPSNDYIQTFNRDNVTLVTDPIDRFAESGIQTQDGTELKVDSIIYATGFNIQAHGATRAVLAPRDGVSNEDSTPGKNSAVSNGVAKENVSDGFKDLVEEWGDEPNAYLGIVYPGFPNFYFMLGPGTGLGVGSLMLNLECQLSFICQCIRFMIENDVKAMAVKEEVNDEYQDWRRECVKNKAFAHPSCTSWYRNKRGQSFVMWPTQPFFYWWYSLRVNPLEFHIKR